MPVQSTIPILGAPDYRDWLSFQNNHSEQEKNRLFMRDIIPCLSDYAEGTIYSATLEEHEWLKEFLNPDSTFAVTRAEVEHRPNEATIILADFVKHLAGTVITVAWQENMKDFVQRVETNPTTGALMNDAEITECRKGFEEALPKLADHPVWRSLRARVRDFSLRIGCPAAVDDPLDCIISIRTHLNSRAMRAQDLSSNDRLKGGDTEKRSHGDYTVAWICPLEVEQVAALEMLDEEHEQLPQPSTDQNVYALGTIAGHNVVIAGLPQAGNNSAATVVTQARATFPNLRYGLLVGIGGGVPTITDNGMIRLGDVVVSKPTGEHSGVVQYDHGKAEEGFFQRTGALAPPPRLLLGAAQVLAAQRARSRVDPVTENIERIDTTIRGSPEVQHGGCDPTNLVQRVSVEEDEGGPTVVVHRGTIASGELVIKDGNLRDDLAERYNVLCFETEAAGVLTNFPCMVIRGISDYSDSHKNDIWHGYVAAAAAAYARALFFHMPMN
ncbi:hypothetical protein BFJ66_g14394 [Fusarium oxysporum f. sp. cepae]|uniref:Nucleoside phosphorylase domain-containing protein n=1 Tax=Fusarium oxysporum f. sp. cepae TaxID=396571 RepID=A0A3L6N8M3_FUSOX|nr:hypothetical protein BFJ65_g12852 [Fusarium oxysporum f. sp. cepae]RKK34517.1 hypothetical protein BFJ66_g14394 [Fusarium oxysporum f. sp. cepae]